MRRAIGFAIVFLLAAGTSNAQELGVSVFGGYSIPGVSRLYCGRGSLGDRDLQDLRTAWLYCGSDSQGDLLFDETNYYPMQAGLIFAGDLFLRIDQFDLGIGTFMFTKGGISGSLISNKDRMEKVKARDFTRTLRSAFVFVRGRAKRDSSFVPYLGAGIGIYGLRESEPYEHSNWEIGPLLKIVAGGEARIAESFPRIFSEIGLNFAALNSDPEPGMDFVRCCGWHMAFTTFTVTIGMRFARQPPAAKLTPYTRMPGR